MADGYLDTNVLVHPLFNDAQSAECRRFVAQLRTGQVTAVLESVVVHELTYTLQRVRRLSREATSEYLLGVLKWKGIEADRATLVDAITRWRDTPGLGLIDAYLAARSTQSQLPVFTKNVRELTAQGASVPDPLPGPDPI